MTDPQAPVSAETVEAIRSVFTNEVLRAIGALARQQNVCREQGGKAVFVTGMEAAREYIVEHAQPVLESALASERQRAEQFDSVAELLKLPEGGDLYVAVDDLLAERDTFKAKAEQATLLAEVHRADSELLDSIGVCGDVSIREGIDAILAKAEQAERERDMLRTALAGIVGASDPSELEAMEAAVRMMSAPADDKARSIDAIHALLATVTK